MWAIVRVSAAGLAGFLVISALFYALNARFPYMQPGGDLMLQMKRDLARHGNPFLSSRGSPAGNPNTGKLHVMAFGYSKMLAGFMPKVFDAELAQAGFPAVESYNFGLPGDSRFVADLEAMAARGTAPDIALLTFPWPPVAEQQPSFFHFINDDIGVMDTLFPFRHLPRNFVIMTVEAHGFAGIPQRYADSRRSVEQSIADRGYYFIVRESRYKNDELPPDFSEPTDTPNKVLARTVTLGPIYNQLAPVLAAHHIQCIFIPNYYRIGQYAPAPAVNEDTAKVIAGQPNVSLEGPDYWVYPNHDFSESAHAGKPGARIYTTQVAGLVVDWLRHHYKAQQ